MHRGSVTVWGLIVAHRLLLGTIGSKREALLQIWSSPHLSPSMQHHAAKTLWQTWCSSRRKSRCESGIRAAYGKGSSTLELCRASGTVVAMVGGILCSGTLTKVLQATAVPCLHGNPSPFSWRAYPSCIGHIVKLRALTSTAASRATPIPSGCQLSQVPSKPD